MLLISSASDLPTTYHGTANRSSIYLTFQPGPTPAVFHSKFDEEHVYNRELIAQSYSLSLIKQYKWLVTFGSFSRLYPFVNWMKGVSIGSFVRFYGPRYGGTLGATQRMRDEFFQGRLEELIESTGEKKDDVMQTSVSYRKPITCHLFASSAILNSFVDSQTLGNEPIPPTSLRSELLTFLLAGADTVAAGLCASIFHILQSPDAVTKILAETTSARKASYLSSPAQCLEILQHCPLLVACIKESMRVCHSFPNILPRLVSQESPLVLSDGREVPPGTEGLSNPWVFHHDSAVYGEYAEVWRPERWCKEGAEILESLNFTFGFGIRVYLGKDIAMMKTMKGVLAVGFFLVWWLWE